jgi:hypothetical protein
MTPDGKFSYRGVLQSDHLVFFYKDQQMRVDFPVALESLVCQGRQGAESIRELIGKSLPGDLSPGRLLVEIPPSWGSFSITTPHPPSVINNPLVLCRELELNAPDLPTAYHLDYHSTDEGALILVLRSIVVEFLQELFRPLGLDITAVRFQDQNELSQTFDMKQSRSWSDLLTASRRQRPRWPKVLLLTLLPLLVIGALWLWGDRFFLDGFKNPPPMVVDTISQPAEEVALQTTIADSNLTAQALSTGEEPGVTLIDGVTENEPIPATVGVENSLARKLYELMAGDTLDYVSILPGWLTWRTRTGHYDSLSLSSDREMPSYQQLDQRLLSYDELMDMLNGSELESAARIVLLRDGAQFNLLWYH